VERWPVYQLVGASVGLVVLAALLLTAPTPSVVPRIPGGIGGDVVQARVVQIIESSTRNQGGQEQPFARLLVRAEDGPIAGQTLEVEERAIGAGNQIRSFAPGDRVLLNYTRLPDGTANAYITEYVRRPQLLWLAALFAVTIGLVGGWQGLSSLLGLAVSFLVILRFIIPHILNGENPVLISVIGALLVQVATLYLSHGLSRKTTAGLGGTVLALLITGALGITFINWMRLTGYGSEEASYLSRGCC
jgi:uncharacterized membrane protein